MKNGAPFLGAAITSILGQSFDDLELVVVDDGSTDETVEIARHAVIRDERVRVVPNRGAGVVDALHTGIDATHGELIARMDSDDVALPWRLERQVRYLRRNPHVGLLGGAIEMIDEAGRLFKTVSYPTDTTELHKLVLERVCFASPTTVMTRSAVTDVGGFRHLYESAEDVDLCLRIADRYVVANLPDPLVRYRIHGDNVSVRAFRKQKEAVVVALAAARRRRAGGCDPTAAVETLASARVALGIGDDEIEAMMFDASINWIDLLSEAGADRRFRDVVALARLSVPFQRDPEAASRRLETTLTRARGHAKRRRLSRDAAGHAAGEHPVELAIGSIFKNEAPYLREWIEFHRLVGVERFYLYDNGSDDDSLDVLEPYRRAGIAVVSDWPYHADQLRAYTDCVRRRAGDAVWIAFIDVDEFFFAPDGRDLRAILADFDRPEIGGVVVNYADFGTSGHIVRPARPVIESFLHRVGPDARVPLPHLLRDQRLDPADLQSYFPMNAHVSSVVRPERVLGFASVHHAEYRGGTHAVTENGEPSDGPVTNTVSMRQLRMNHYWTKSVEECRRKFLRGRADTTITRRWPHEFIVRERVMRELDVDVLHYLEPLRSALGIDGPPIDEVVAAAAERMRRWSPEAAAREVDGGGDREPTGRSVTGGAASADVNVLSEGMEWLDGSESRVLSVLERARDRSAGSDELASAMTDWPTRYHFSRLRSRILSPLRIVPGARVLDLGGGTGPLSRKLGELGADVVLLDGSAKRARAAAARCKDLPNVSVSVGTISDLGDATGSFDIVVAVGLLEYAVSSPGGAVGMLRDVASLLASHGVLAVAIENAIGLKYLLGHAEDHLGLPWVGWGGYVGVDHVRTYSRRELAGLLSDVGLSEQLWFYPFPDYKLPTVIVSDAAYVLGEAEIVDAVVREPCGPDTSLPVVPSDPRAAHRTMLRAGLGRDVANSFLVIAATTKEALEERVDRDTLAWLHGDERRSSFMRNRRLVQDGESLAIVDDSAERGGSEDGWLIQKRFAKVTYEPGESFDRRLLDVLAARDSGPTRDLLVLWAEVLRGAAVVSNAAQAGDSVVANPFRPESGGLALPGDYLDAQPSNFVYRDGRLFRIDAEWHAKGSVDLELVGLRSLFYFSVGVLGRGRPHPFETEISVKGLVFRLLELAGLPASERGWRRFGEAEAAFQALVGGASPETIRDRIARTSGSTAADLRGDVVLDSPAVVRELRETQTQLAKTEAALRDTAASLDELLGSETWRVGRLVVRPLAFAKRVVRRRSGRAAEARDQG